MTAALTGTTTMTELDKVIDKVAKLRRLAAGAGTPEEAAAAAAKAQELMFAHNIAEAMVDGRKATEDDRYVNDRGTVVTGVWRQDLLVGITRTNFCRCVFTYGQWTSGRKSGVRVSIVGTRENVDHVLGLWQWLVSELEPMADRALKEYRERTWSEVSGRTWKNSFYHGAVQAILRRLRAQRKDDETKALAGGQSTALMVLQTGLDNAMTRYYPKLGTSSARPNSKLLSSGYQAGRAAGESMSLTRTARIA